MSVALSIKYRQEYYDHFLKLHCAMRVLSDPVQCILNNDLAYQLLKAFVRDFELLYGREKVTYNAHNLLHIPADVKRMKVPVDSYSAFKFENYMQYIKKLPRTGYRVLEQIHNRIYEKNSIENFVGDFKEKTKNDRPIKNSTLFRKIFVSDMVLSVKNPDNYVYVEGKIHKIEELSKTADGNIKMKCRIVEELECLYSKPVSSIDVGIFVGSQEKLSEGFHRILSKSTKKCVAINFRGKYIYMSLLH